MITANRKGILMGLGDLGLVVPVHGMGRAPEDSMLVGAGSKMQRHSVLLGALTRNLQPAAPAPALITPTKTIALRPITAPTPPYIPPVYPQLPRPEAPRQETTVTSPGGKMMPPMLVSPSGATSNWPQTPASPVPLSPPVRPPAIPATPAVGDSNYWDAQTSESKIDSGSPGAGFYAGGWSPYVTPDSGTPAGAQTALVSVAAGSPADTSAAAASATVNPDGSITQADGTIVDQTGAVIGTDWITWASAHKVGIGIGALAIVGGIVILAKVL